MQILEEVKLISTEVVCFVNLLTEAFESDGSAETLMENMRVVEDMTKSKLANRFYEMVHVRSFKKNLEAKDFTTCAKQLNVQAEEKHGIQIFHEEKREERQKTAILKTVIELCNIAEILLF